MSTKAMGGVVAASFDPATLSFKELPVGRKVESDLRESNRSLFRRPCQRASRRIRGMNG